MTRIILIISFAFLFSCEKETHKPGNTCKTCTERVISSCFAEPNDTSYTWVKTYCDYEWMEQDGKTWTTTNNVNGNLNCSQIHLITCK